MSIEEDENAGRTQLVAYRMMAESSEKTQDRRQAANNFFIVMNVAIGGGYAFMIENDQLGLIAPGCLLGVVICILWLVTLIYYRELSSAKYGLLGEYEVTQGIAGYQREWELFVAHGIFGRVKIGRWRLSLSTIEMAVAVLALFAHATAPWTLHPRANKEGQSAAISSQPGAESAKPAATPVDAPQK